MPHARSVALSMYVQAGSRFEASPDAGLSHFVEHLCFKGTTRRTAREIALSLESLGGSLDAYTSREQICFQARVLDEHLPLALDMAHLYAALLQGLIPLPARPQEQLADWVARVELAGTKRREVEKTQARLAKERQFNRKVEINAHLRQLKNELEELTGKESA